MRSIEKGHGAFGRWRRALLGMVAVLTVLGTFVFAAQQAPTAKAYNLEQARWAQSGHTYGTCCMTFYYSFPSGEYIGSVHAWQNGITGWNIINQTWPSDVLFVDGTACVPQGCGMGSEGDTNDSNTQEDGWSNLTWNPANGQFIGTQYGYINDYYVNSYPSPKSQSVAAHELGHQIGLDHWGPWYISGNSGPVHCDWTTLMDPGTGTRFDQCGISQPRQDDVNGANAMY